MRESDFPAVLARPAPILAPEAAESMDMVTIHWKSMDFQWKSMDFDEKPWFSGFSICYDLQMLSHDTLGGPRRSYAPETFLKTLETYFNINRKSI